MKFIHMVLQASRTDSKRKPRTRRAVNSRFLVWNNSDSTILPYIVYKVEFISDVQVGTYINDGDNIRGNRK